MIQFSWTCKNCKSASLINEYFIWFDSTSILLCIFQCISFQKLSTLSQLYLSNVFLNYISQPYSSNVFLKYIPQLYFSNIFLSSSIPTWDLECICTASPSNSTFHFQEVTFSTVFLNCISQTVFHKLYFSNCISQGVALCSALQSVCKPSQRFNLHSETELSILLFLGDFCWISW